MSDSGGRVGPVRPSGSGRPGGPQLGGPMVAAAALALAFGVAGSIAAGDMPWVNRAFRRLRARASDATGKLREAARAYAATDEARPQAPGADVRDFAAEVDAALAGARSGAASLAKKRRLISTLMGASIVADRARAFSDPGSAGGARLGEWERVLSRLTTPDVTALVNRMLATHPQLLDAESSRIFSAIFGGGHHEDGRYIPVTEAAIRRALRLPQALSAPASSPAPEGRTTDPV